MRMSRRETEASFAADSLVEGDGFEPSVPGEGTPTHASVTYDRYRRLSRRSDLCPLTVAVAIRADTVVGSGLGSSFLHG